MSLPPRIHRTVLLTGGRAPVTLELSRAFSHSGCRVVVADTFGTALSRWSRSVDAYVRVPSPAYDLQGFQSAMLQAVHRYGVDEVIPTCEETFYVSMIRDSLPCRVWTMDIETLGMLHDKLAFARAAHAYMPVPETIAVTEFAKWDQSENYVFKPRYSRFAARTIIGRRVGPENFDKPDEWIAQRRILGMEYCVYSVWQHGTMSAISIYHPRLRAGQGAGIFLEVVEHPEIEAMVKRFGEGFTLHGQHSFDVIVDAETTTPYVIECNPRATSGAHLLGTSVAEAFFGTALQEPVPLTRRAIWYAMALYHPRTLVQREFRNAADVVYLHKDPLPAILQGLSLLHFVTTAWRNRCSILEATTLDIEWNG